MRSGQAAAFELQPLPNQRAGEWEVWQTSLHNPDFAEYARICGGLGIRVIDREQLDEALARALAYDGPAMVEVITDPELV